ncbi:MAG: primosomal protein N', partial [Ancrocorticia sp.]
MHDELPGLGALPDYGEQGSLLDAGVSTRSVVGDVSNPVAHVHLEVPQPHMDRVFDYLIPAKLDETARVGTRVMVDVGARQVPGFIVARDSVAGAGAQLRPLRRVVSPLPVLSEAMYQLCHDVAARQAASVADVLRLAIPPRHARAEKEFVEAGDQEPAKGTTSGPIGSGLWEHYRGGPAFIERIAAGGDPRAVCAALPGKAGSIRALATACCAAITSGRSALIVAPTTREAHRLAERLGELTGAPVALYLGEAQNSERYRTFLEILHGRCSIVVGTRGAMWAPLPDLGL